MRVALVNAQDISDIVIGKFCGTEYKMAEETACVTHLAGLLYRRQSEPADALFGNALLDNLNDLSCAVVYF